jgi:aldehyde dehydrogenase (NAD+)
MNYKDNIDYRKETLVKLLDNLIIQMKLLTLCIRFQNHHLNRLLLKLICNYRIKAYHKKMKSWSKRTSVLPSIINFPSEIIFIKSLMARF